MVVWYSHLFKNFPQFVVIHTARSFSVVNEAEVGVFLEFPCRDVTKESGHLPTFLFLGTKDVALSPIPLRLDVAKWLALTIKIWT